MNLWNNQNCTDWDAALTQYEAVIAAQGVRGLVEVDAWYRTKLPALVAARTKPYVTRAELVRVTTWKMKRGVWRERNRLLVIGNSPSTVKTASARAFAAIPDLRQPIAILSDLEGVGPATASAVLASHTPDLYPFFDELVAQQVPHLGRVAFTPAYYQRYAGALRERAAKLNTRCDHRKWSAHAVSQALWAFSGGKAAQLGSEEHPARE